VAAADKSPDRHASGLGGRHTLTLSSINERAARIGRHSSRRHTGRGPGGFAAFHHLRCIEPIAEVPRKAVSDSDRETRSSALDEATNAGFQAFQHRT